MNNMHPQSHQHQFVYGSTNSSTSVSSDSTTTVADHHHPTQDFPVIRGGEEERYGASLFQQQKKLENWEDQVLNLNPTPSNFARNNSINHVGDVKQEVNNAAAAQSTTSSQLNYDDDQFIITSSWPHHQIIPLNNSTSPTSCVTTLSNNNFFNFSGAKPPAAVAATTVDGKNHHHNQEHSSECNSTSSGGVSKKARVQQSSAQPVLKVRKEKLGDSITALHQLVSPFGKTDTASVLSEAIGYIRFLQGQIEALSSPYMRNASVNSGHPHHSVQERNCLFPEEAAGQDSQSRGVKDLRSRGLCLVPISCTENVGNDNGADYWAPAALGGGF
ncbi:hypothetical protein DH2020_013284 [Rehmannia glutinosa]|uniref:BHLH domain-containing protein n=1 Tax=Rehmannia glutinosa TaxID=99300 RepID=A0ABR0X5L8_REHGL